MLLDIRCSRGKLQVVEEGVLRVQSFNDVVWQVPCAALTAITTQPSAMMTVKVIFHTTQGTHTAEMVTKQNFESLRAIFPHIAVTVAGKEWYHDPQSRTHIETYTDQKKMQREVEAAAQHGWMIQGQSGTGSHVNVGRTVTKLVLTGGLGMMTGASRSKEKTTLTFVRTQEWRERH